MKIKGILGEQPITVYELKEELLSVEAVRLEKEKEMSYELRQSIVHANQIAKISAEKSHELVEKLLKLEKISPNIAYRIANLMPQTRGEVRAVFAKDKYAHTKEEIDTTIELVVTHY